MTYIATDRFVYLLVHHIIRCLRPLQNNYFPSFKHYAKTLNVYTKNYLQLLMSFLPVILLKSVCIHFVSGKIVSTSELLGQLL